MIADAYKILTTTNDAISDSCLKSKLQEVCSNFELDMTTGKVSLFDCLKAITVVVKTRKLYGFNLGQNKFYILS
jgi:hypothetical protein